MGVYAAAHEIIFQPMIKQYGCLLVITAFLLVAGSALAEEQSLAGVAEDCSDISINYVESPHLTRREKLDRMDRALLDSLNRYERCQNASSRSSSAAAGGAAGGGGAGAADGGGDGSEQQTSSTASSEMSGTETAPEKEVAESSSAAVSASATERESGHKKQMPGSGKVPDDIPPADNDSILEEQIRQAAMNETDPEIREKLWNEYRKYKGLPAVTSKPERVK